MCGPFAAADAEGSAINCVVSLADTKNTLNPAPLLALGPKSLYFKRTLAP